MASVRKLHIQKFVKRIDTITCRKVLKDILNLDEECKRHFILSSLVNF